MAAIMYLYAVVCIGVCIGAAFVGLSAYTVSRRRILVYLSVFLLCYAVEQSLIFLNEFLAQNLPFQAEAFFSMEDPLLHLALGAALCQSLWLALLQFFDENGPRLRWLPLAGFVLISLVALIVPLGTEAVRKWAFYGARQLFFLWMILYCLVKYRTTDSQIVKTRCRRRAPLLAVFAALVVLIFVEDTLVMLLLDPVTIADNPVLAYLYRRNTCESLLVFCVVAFTLQQSLRALSLKREERPAPHEEDGRAQIKDILPYFAKKHGLTPREQEILGYVVEGMDNQQISRKLQVSIGTVKTHTHHLFKKTGTGNREELLRAFWAEQ